jgi:hypothetical protein
MEALMKVLTIRRNPGNREEVEVHLELAATLRAVAGSIGFYGLFVMLGVALHRAYSHLLG